MFSAHTCSTSELSRKSVAAFRVHINHEYVQAREILLRPTLGHQGYLIPTTGTLLRNLF